MNMAVLAATLRERLTNVMTLILVAALVLLPLPMSASGLVSASSIVSSLGVVLVIGAGCIGREVSSGSLALVFCRPIRRSEYVLTKWLAISGLTLAVGMLQLGAQLALCRYAGVAVSLASLGQNAFERVTVTFGVAAVLVLFSTFCKSSSDVVLWSVAAIGAKLADSSDRPRLSWVGREVYAQLAPELSYVHVFHSRPFVWSAVFGYGATVCLALALACWVLGRKEISYAA